MASISSTNSSTSLGNTSLRGFGGMASGIDRDSIIEQMTLGTTTKINNQKKKVTELGWKQEAYREVSDKILDWADKYASYSSSSNLRDPSAFAKNQITVHGTDAVKGFITATGSSALINNVSIKGVEQLASATVHQSGQHIKDNGLQTTLDLDKMLYSSKLEGGELRFGVYDEKNGWSNVKTFTFKSSYTEEVDGKKVTHNINYTPKNEAEAQELVNDLNKLLENSEIKLNETTTLSEAIEFTYDSTSGKIGINEKKETGYKIQTSGDSYVMKALGYTGGSTTGGIEIKDFDSGVGGKLHETAVSKQSTLEYLTGKKVTFNYNGSKKEIELITSKEKEAIVAAQNEGKSDAEIMGLIRDNLQARLNQAYGNGTGGNKGAIEVEVSADGKGLNFKTEDETSTVSIISNSTELLNNMGIEYGASNKVNLDGKLTQFDWGKDIADGPLDLTINGVKIEGLTKNSTISDILSKINSTSAAGVKATYVDATGQFMLVSSETGAGRNIDLGDSDSLAQKLFGDVTKSDGSVSQADTKMGQNAIIHVSYGNGVDVKLERASNTFNLEGLNITVSGTFGVKYEADGTVMKDPNGKTVFDTSQTITFTAKADVDGAVEKVKSFFEEFNEIVTMVSGHVRTRPDSNYGALTDEQKAEMDETSIENWEKKAKQGILYGDSAMQDLSGALEGIFTKLMQNGASYDDLKEIGITYSEDYLDGGTLVFDEAKFRDAMESNPEKVSNIFTGGGNVRKGLVDVIDETFTPYATKYASKNGGDSYGRLIDIAGSEKKPITLNSNEIYKQLKEMQETIEKLQQQLQVEQDRYISQFTTMETLLNQMNTQQSYLSQLTG